ncbi:MAG: hypothetical protein EPO36_06735 [Chloroflexota bacterium]|nr:MAG: hypothetical protein EPO36_06735 [Chloroflexota bacterium]
MTPRSSSRLRRVTTSAAFALAIAFPSSALADANGGIEPAYSTGATVSILSTSFDNKLMATVELEITCDPFPLIDPYTGEPTGPTTQPGRIYGEILLMQAQGRSIAHAAGILRAGDSGGMYQGLPVTCDGVTAQQFVVAVIAQDLPLKRGAAVMGVVVRMSATETPPCCSGWFGSNAASTGPVSVKLR